MFLKNETCYILQFITLFIPIDYETINQEKWQSLCAENELLPIANWFIRQPYFYEILNRNNY